MEEVKNMKNINLISILIVVVTLASVLSRFGFGPCGFYSG
jgi:hypothetical protein